MHLERRRSRRRRRRRVGEGEGEGREGGELENEALTKGKDLGTHLGLVNSTD